jgi:WD repeat-containing protein 68
VWGGVLPKYSRGSGRHLDLNPHSSDDSAPQHLQPASFARRPRPQRSTRRDAMPFGNHHQNAHNNPAAGIYQAAAALGSIGAPMGNLRVATAGQTSAGTDAFQPAQSLQSPVEQQAYSSGGHTAPPAAQAAFDAPRRAPTLSRAPDSELHIAPTSASAAPSSQQQQQHLPPQSQQQQQQQQQQQGMYSADNYSAPNIQLQQATPGGAQYGASSQPIPNALQPAAGVGQPRPAPSSAYTAPAMVPTQAQIPSNAQQYTLPTRSNTIHQSQPSPHSSHSYSRSSPAGMGPEQKYDQKYIPFSNTPEQSKYAPNTPAQKYYPSTPSGAASHSPLGLADIRPRANSSMDQEGGMGHGNAMMTEHNKVPSNSNYLAPWSIYAYDWCKWNVPGGNSAGKMAVGSYLEDNHNFIRILDTQIIPQEGAAPGASPYGLEYTAVAEATCSFPVTRILWEPPSTQKQSTDLLATSGDHLRLWSLPQNAPNTMSNTITRSSSVNTREPQLPKLTPLALLSNSKTPEHTAPLTSLDWNTMSPKLIITSSIDTTCTIWDIPSLTAKTQLIAHDKEVFDVRFCAGSVDVFVSCGADGSVRMFDLRSLEHSTIIYEPSDKNGDRDKGKWSWYRCSDFKLTIARLAN